MKSYLRIIPLLLAGSFLFTACGKSSDSNNITLGNEEVPVQTQPAVSSVPSHEVPVNETKEDGTCDIHITIESVEISEADLKANDYVVPVYVNLDQNAGITYSEWGASYDSRCTLEYDTFDQNVLFDTICSVNDEEHFFWTAWASSNGNQRIGSLILLKLKLPETASAGDTFPVTYASYSLGDKAHVWDNNDISWVDSGVIGWTDGGVTVTE